jgi:hypothetical protein
MSVPRVARMIVDGMVILGMILFVIFRFAMLGNAYLPPLGSPIADWGEIARCFLWLIVPLYITRLAFKTRRWAGYVCFLGVPLAAYFPSSIYFLPDWNKTPFSSGVMAALFMALGLYLLLTSAFGCPPVLAPSPQPTRLRRWVFISGYALVCGLGLIWTVFIALTPRFADCFVIPPSAKPKFPNQALFIATDAVSFGKKPAPDDITMPMPDGFAIAHIREHFWGLPWWSRRFVLLWRPPQFKGEIYFYDGGRPLGLLTHFLPIVCYNYCGRTSLVSDAEIDLRVLKDGPSQTTGRIFGHFFRPTDGPRQGEAGVKVMITGPERTIVTATDTRGLYDAPDLAPGEYSIHIDVPPQSWVDCTSPIKLEPGNITECDAAIR